MKTNLLISFFCFASVLTLPLAAQALNFINILVDDMGYSDIGCMGGPVDTP